MVRCERAHLSANMLGALLLSALAGLAASTFDPELHAKCLHLPRDQFVDCLKLDDIPRIELKTKRFNPRMFANLPDNFDAREKWANCATIKDIYDQGNCGSCWAFATATVASDRTCIDKSLTVRLSVQDFDCLQHICKGGRPDWSFPFWKEHGLVTLDCKKYNISNSKKCIRECNDPNMNYLNDKHYAEDVYLISSKEDEIRTELFTNGPLYARFSVYVDFMNYTSGVYEHIKGAHLGYHGVRVIGYGVENDVKYWLAANSWGDSWGDKGFFKIKRYQPLELPFESMLYTGIAKN